MSKEARILLDSTQYTCDNIGEIELALELKRDDGLYYFEKTISESLKFANKAAWDYIKQQTDVSIDTQISVQIQQFASGTWKDVFVGYFTRINCKFFLDTCRVECEVQRLDNCLLKNREKEVNILETPDPIDLQYEPVFGLEFMIVNNASGIICNISLPEWGTPYSLTADTNVLPFEYRCLYARYVVKILCVAGFPQEPPPAQTAWSLLSDDCATDGTCTFWREAKYPEVSVTLYAYGAADPAQPIGCNYRCVDMGVEQQGVFPAIFNVRYCVCYENFYQYLRNGRYLQNVVAYMLGEICPDYELQSELLTNSTNPVTGDPNPLENLIIFQKSDIVVGSPSEFARVGMLSLKDLFSDMSTMLNAAWYVDEINQKLVFEHISDVVDMTVGIDLTTYQGGIWANKKNTYSYDESEIPQRELYKFPNPTLTLDFTGYPIEYDIDKVNDKDIENRLQRIETEIVRIFGNENEGLDGFVLVSEASVLQDDFFDTDGAISGYFIPNAPLSWGNLHRDYHSYYRRYPTGTLNNTPTTFDSTQPVQRQERVRFNWCDFNDFNPLQRIRTHLGDGVVQSAKYNLQQRTLSCTLKFEL